MVFSESIINISENFNQQIKFYFKILDLSAQQLHILEEGGGQISVAEINALLAERQKVMEEINQLNIQNKGIQKEISQELGIDEFVLTRLEHEIDEAQYQDLKTLIAKMGEMLRTISDKDEQSQLLMRQGLKPGLRQNIRIDNGQASNAYKQAMKQIPPK